MNSMLDRIRGCLYGVAVGDALGAPVEFMSADAIKNTHGRVDRMIGGGWLNVKPGEVTDDTQMTLCVADGIASQPEDPIAEIGENFIAWIYSGPKDVGGCCASAITNALSISKRPTHGQWLAASGLTAIERPGRISGNGTLMRTAYVGLYYKDTEKIREMASEISMMTHLDEEAAFACSLYSEMIDQAVQGRSRDSVLALARGTQYDSAVMNLRIPFEPTGFVVNSMSIALQAITKHHDYRLTLIDAVNRGGDADTNGAITGGLAGAIYGYSNIPKDWISCLDKDIRTHLDVLANIAYQVRIS